MVLPVTYVICTSGLLDCTRTRLGMERQRMGLLSTVTAGPAASISYQPHAVTSPGLGWAWTDREWDHCLQPLQVIQLPPLTDHTL
ncbi:hypothetical protein RRG08_059994 [Elysia crispata]|uniref:Uncharacterized protein n=1 Tax=Elysia crispata TaxID=231223 RepID=A0AAE0YED8_9GAST|nr:hypothetical protein RRG08_059994 [Elysia crispata]